MSRDVGWYVRRLQRMSATEVAGRVRDQARQRAWSGRQVLPGRPATELSGLRAARLGPIPLPPGIAEGLPAEARSAVIEAADRLVAGEWTVLGVDRPDILDPDWFLDPASGRRAPAHDLAFRIDHRDESVTGNVKSVWELSRHHHLTVLAAAYWLTDDEVYAELVDRHLRSWWAANPFLSGVHWTSGIELGLRLISWAWVRRLLDGWPKVGDLFETNDEAVHQIWWHQRVPRGLPQPRILGQQPCGRRGSRTPGRGLRLPLVRRVRHVAPRRRCPTVPPLPGQHLRGRREPRAGHGLPPLRHRARLGRGGRGRGRRGRPAVRGVGPAGRELRRRCGHARRDRRTTPPGRRRRGPRPGHRQPRARDLARPPRLGQLGRGRLRLVARDPADGGGRRARRPARECPHDTGETDHEAAPLLGRRHHDPEQRPRVGAGDLVSLRRRTSRVPRHRRPRARGRLVGGGPSRRRRDPGRPRHVLLPR